jgi:hypothetical protein
VGLGRVVFALTAAGRGGILRAMTRAWLAVALVALAAPAPAWAGKREADDLRRQIDVQRSGAGDLERLDDRRTVVDEITMLRTWIDEAVSQHQKEKFDRVRDVLDRCAAQSELIRQKIVASRLTAQADEREAALTASRQKVEQTKTAIGEATVKKKAMEMNAK